MNKIYKVVWNRARGCYVVASEFAKNTAKSASVKALAVAVLAAGVMTAGFSGSAWAAGDGNYYSTNGVIAGSAVNIDNKGAQNFFGVVAGIQSSSGGMFSTIIGSGSYIDGAPLSLQGFGSVIDGSLNTISLGEDPSKLTGIANSITGVANGILNANGAVIIGTGNSISNAEGKISEVSDELKAKGIEILKGDDVAEEKLKKVQELLKEYGDKGGSVMAIGGANKADYTIFSQMTGVGNTIIGTDEKISTNNSYTGVDNKGTNINYTTVIGTENSLENTQKANVFGNSNSVSGGEQNIVIGDNHELTEAKNNIVLGYSDGVKTHLPNLENTVIIGHNANAGQDSGVAIGNNAQAEGKYSVAIGDASEATKDWAVVFGQGAKANFAESVALGSNSIADTDKGVRGYLAPDGDNSAVWQSTASAVSVGNAEKEITRQITNVAAGKEDTDAVNVAQLRASNQVIQNNAENISRLGHTVDKLGSRVNKVGAGAAALAALHPLDFDPDEKLNVAAGYGHYKGEDAASIGAFYRPNEDTMFSIGGTVGNGEDMINVGVSFRFGQQNHQTRTKKEMAKEIIDLRMEVAELKAMMYNLSGRGISLDPAKQELFPDVPENHWAYEYVAALKGNGILEGYADGSFDGARPMTRYEFAAALYRALGKGVAVDERMLKEFGDVLARIRVDVLTRDHNNEPRIERVRVIPKVEQKAARGLVQPVNAAE